MNIFKHEAFKNFQILTQWWDSLVRAGHILSDALADSRNFLDLNTGLLTMKE